MWQMKLLWNIPSGQHYGYSRALPPAPAALTAVNAAPHAVISGTCSMKPVLASRKLRQLKVLG
jgi:hypothetical protein